MEKFSLFDLLSFAFPGAVSLVLIYWTATNAIHLPVESVTLPNALLTVVLLMLAYFMGHIINEIGMRLEPKIGPMPKSWADILRNNPDLATRLNTISEKVFGAGFLTEKGDVDINQSDVFYDRAFAILEMNGKQEKVKTLQSQYVFFRNSVVLATLAVLCFGIVLVAHLRNGVALGDPPALLAGLGMLISAGLIRISRILSIKRRRMKMSATLHNFYAFYISETKLKEK